MHISSVIDLIFSNLENRLFFFANDFNSSKTIFKYSSLVFDSLLYTSKSIKASFDRS